MPEYLKIKKNTENYERRFPLISILLHSAFWNGKITRTNKILPNYALQRDRMDQFQPDSFEHDQTLNSDGNKNDCVK